MKRMICMVMVIGMASSISMGALLGDLSATDVSLSGTIIDDSESYGVPADMFDGTSNYFRFQYQHVVDNAVKALLNIEFDDPVNITEIVFTFNVGNTNHFFPTVLLFRDVGRTQPIDSLTGNYSPAVGTYTHTFDELDAHDYDAQGLDGIYVEFYRHPNANPDYVNIDACVNSLLKRPC